MGIKDWVGDAKSVFKSLGASSHSEGDRETNDFYATDPEALEVFLSKLKQDGIVLPHKICEPACGMGHLSEVLKKHGYDVSSYDLYDHGYGEIGIDFLKSDIKAKCFLTNPPYKYALEFVKKAIENVSTNGYVIMLLKIQFLEGKKRYEFFKRNPPRYIYVNSSRQNCAKNGDFKNYDRNSAVCFSWFIWEKDFVGEPTVRWIE